MDLHGMATPTHVVDWCDWRSTDMLLAQDAWRVTLCPQKSTDAHRNLPCQTGTEGGQRQMEHDKLGWAGKAQPCGTDILACASKNGTQPAAQPRSMRNHNTCPSHVP